MIMETREEMFNYIFDILEDLALVNWTKMYNRKLLLKAFSQTNISANEFCNKKVRQFNASIRKIFNKHELFNAYKGKTESWHIFLLRLIEYKKCSKCNKTLHINEFYTDNYTISKRSNQCKGCSSIYYINNKDEILERTNAYKKQNKEKIKINNKKYYIEHVKEKKEYYEENKGVILENGKKKRLENKKYIVNELGGCCSSCGYNKNYAALDIHHKDMTLKRLPWTIDINGKNKPPGHYLINIVKSKMIKFFEVEKNNLKLLCKNCHQKSHYTGTVDTQKGLKESLMFLGYLYSCQYNECKENHYLHLHHNNQNEKELSFSHFQGQSKEKILKDGLLELEMKKDVSILCGNHHQEYHHTNHEKGDKP